MIGLRRVLLMVVLLAAGAGFKAGMSSDSSRGGRALSDASNSFSGAVLFGAFRPLLLDHLWSRAAVLQTEGRYWEVVDTYDRLARLDPTNERVWLLQANILVYDIAQLEVERGERQRLYRSAVRHLEEGIIHNPDVFALRELLYRTYMDRIRHDGPVDRYFRRMTGRGGLEWAVVVAGEAREQLPHEPWSHILMHDAAQATVREILRAGDVSRAAATTRDLASLEDDMVARGLDRGLALRPAVTRAWGDRLDDLAAGIGVDAQGNLILLDEARLESLLDRLAVMVTPPDLTFPVDIEGVSQDAEVFSLIHFRVIGLCQSLAVTEKHGAGLQLLSRVNRISLLADGRIGVARPYYSASYADALNKFIEVDRDLVAVRAADQEPSTELIARWRTALVGVEAAMQDRSMGRSDGFADRVAVARHLNRN